MLERIFPSNKSCLILHSLTSNQPAELPILDVNFTFRV